MRARRGLKLEESEVKDAVKTHFEEQGYFPPKKEFNIGVRPDIVAFRWINEGHKLQYEIEAVAVECKSTKRIRSLVETGLTQAREYQLAFPYVYLAAPKLDTESLETLKKMMGFLRMGLLSVNDSGVVEEELESSVSPRLRKSEFLYKVRQRAVALLTYNEVVGEPFDLNVQKPDEVHCFRKKEAANFLLSSGGPPERDYYFGICIEQQENVKKTLKKMEEKQLHKLFADLPGDYYVDLTYIDTYRPREVAWPVLVKKVRELSEGDVKWLLNYCKEKKWKICLILKRKVWNKDEVLSRKEHNSRVKRAMEELTSLRQTLIST